MLSQKQLTEKLDQDVYELMRVISTNVSDKGYLIKQNQYQDLDNFIRTKIINSSTKVKIEDCNLNCPQNQNTVVLPKISQLNLDEKGWTQ